MLDVAGSAGQYAFVQLRMLVRAYPTQCCQLKVLLALANDIIQQPSASWYKAALCSSLSVSIIAAIVLAGDSLLPILNGSLSRT
jgi:hypothetical protein